MSKDLTLSRIAYERAIDARNLRYRLISDLAGEDADIPDAKELLEQLLNAIEREGVFDDD